MPLNVSLTIPGEGVPAYEFTSMTDENGIFTIVGIEPGTPFIVSAKYTRP